MADRVTNNEVENQLFREIARCLQSRPEGDLITLLDVSMQNSSDLRIGRTVIDLYLCMPRVDLTTASAMHNTVAFLFRRDRCMRMRLCTS